MKKITLTISLIYFAYSSFSQVWSGSTVSTNTTGDVTIGTGFTSSIPSKLSISSGYGINCASCAISNPSTGIKLSWNAPNLMCGSCSAGISGSIPDILYFYSPPVFPGGSNYSIMRLTGSGQFSIYGDPYSYFKNTFYGRTYFNDHVQFKSKLRINSGIIAYSDWTPSSFSYSFSVDNGDSRFLGKVQIGNLSPNGAFSTYKLGVDGDVVCKKMVVEITDWADFVFDKNYNLTSLEDVKEYIALNKCLPDMPNEKTIIENGLDVSAMQKFQQKKLEELTLYIIQQQDLINELSKKIEKMERINE